MWSVFLLRLKWIFLSASRGSMVATLLTPNSTQALVCGIVSWFREVFCSLSFQWKCKRRRKPEMMVGKIIQLTHNQRHSRKMMENENPIISHHFRNHLTGGRTNRYSQPQKNPLWFVNIFTRSRNSRPTYWYVVMLVLAEKDQLSLPSNHQSTRGVSCGTVVGRSRRHGETPLLFPAIKPLRLPQF